MNLSPNKYSAFEDVTSSSPSLVLRNSLTTSANVKSM